MLIRQALRFAFVGIGATATHFVVMVLCVEALALDPVLATLPSFAVAFFVSYVFNRRWTFAASGRHEVLMTRYLLVALVGLALNALIMYVAVDQLAWSYRIGFTLSVLLVPPVTFLCAKTLVFRSSRSPSRSRLRCQD